jgi:phosphomannomutase
MAKEKISLPDPSLVRQVLEATKSAFTGATVDTTDGVKVDLPEGWVHLRPSNTEPIIRVYAESSSPEAAAALAKRAMDVALQILNTAKV